MNRLICIVGLLLSCIGLIVATPIPTSTPAPNDKESVTAQVGERVIVGIPPKFAMIPLDTEFSHLEIDGQRVSITDVDQQGIHFIAPKVSETERWYPIRLVVPVVSLDDIDKEWNLEDFCGEIYIKSPAQASESG